MPEKLPDLTPPVTGAGTYTSRPISITAVQWDGTEDHARQLTDWADSYRGRGSACFIEGQEPLDMGYVDNGKPILLERPAKIRIGTLEGHMDLLEGSWLIKGTEDEFYPCKDSVFQRKYRPATAPAGESSFQLRQHEYAENSFILDHFTGSLLVSREDLKEAYRQLDAFLYPNPGYKPRIAGPHILIQNGEDVG
jgi:hypothetical protein